MKKFLFSIILLTTSLSYSQQKQFTIDWNGTRTLSTSSSKVEVPSFNNSNFSFDHVSGLKYISQWESNGLVNENSLKISNISYLTISKNELKDIRLETIPKKIQLLIKNTNSRGKRSVYFEMSPIINDNGIYKKVRSFTITYNFNQANRSGASSRVIVNSVLNQGDWYKFYIEQTGVFKLSRSFLSSLGISMNNIDPRSIRVFGQGGNMLPMRNSVYYPLDLTENPIEVIGGEDGKFNNNDYILFYGEGPKGYNSESNTNINAYTDKAYYFINVNSGGNAKQVQDYIEPVGVANTTINTFHDYQFHELDEYNLAKLGRRWFGDRFDFDPDKVFDFEVKNIVTSEPVALKVYAAAVGVVQTSMRVRVNGTDVDNFTFPAINSPILATQDFFNGNINVTSGNISVNLTYNNNGNPTSEGYLDYISIEATRSLEGVGEQFLFKNNNVPLLSGIGQYDLSNASNITEVWDVTDKYNITSIQNSDASNTLSFKAQLGEERKYIAIDDSDFHTPKSESKSRVVNQNIKGTVFENAQGQFQDVDYIIIAREDMLGQAERLAQINRDKNKLNVKVYTLQNIYNEFSSGNQDISGIRNFVKYVYDNASTPTNRLKYLCLFGDASFDYKDRVSNNTNVVPSWHSLNSFSLSSSFVSDDFFGMMDLNEGTMHSSDKLDIAVGRVLADTPQRARELVDKIESYYQEEAYGNWRNNVMVVSDDVDESWEGILQQTTDDIANDITQNKPFINAIKVHTDAFVQQSTAGGERYPSVNKAIFDNIEVGALVVNYFGHGGEDGLASERIFDKINAQELKNICKLNCFVTVTCEYTKFDNPLRVTAGEYLYWNKKGGAIGLITTTRQIFVSVGVSFNVVLGEYMFAFGTNDYPSMAEALRLTKNDPRISGVSQRRLVFFIGDPAMKLALPKPSVRLTEINDVPITSNIDVLQALGRAKIKGEVVDESGIVLTNYNGVVTTTIFDKEIDRQTLSNDGTTNGGQRVVMDYKTLGETIFRGQATIVNGVFEFDFVVPRDIGVPVGNGKISFYAKNDNPLQDQAGANFDIQIGGINNNAPEDNEGPIINLFMNDESFVYGGITNESPTLLAKLQDENGINTASGIGHDIIAILDGDETNPYKLNDYYTTEVDDYQNGTVTYPFRDLEPGLHTLTLKAWDVYNNSSTAEIQFVVYDENESLVIDNVLNYPNPFVNYTEFWFNHNSSEVLDVSVQVFTVSGKLVRTLNGQTNGGLKSTSSVSKDIVWDGRDDFGEKIGKGVYVYKLTVRSNQLNKQVEKFEKLVIL
ncbi:type IX secretion system sortase PorU [Flavobacteriaceae bacterium S0825]|uniref:type IX secretion system sortase PorU n=1 Tax=Gaetbulibacter sp. S0825 TaxID=2720084 RepID=UPI0014302379|nr:type IX secretion system sortase PorU [Gaetbulibacter sp. S0825]MCK0110459.1 type IX secretion system sortase PorU [Flavobacteriaceae bacterium S0825]NIX66088.1 type IX secretion system sortase PorU [Gaetbulibacter sp. S0825]